MACLSGFCLIVPFFPEDAEVCMVIECRPTSGMVRDPLWSVWTLSVLAALETAFAGGSLKRPAIGFPTSSLRGTL